MSYRRFVGALLGVFTLILVLCAAVVALIDPFFRYHAPNAEAEVWFDQRCQTAGVLRNTEYETLFMGSSLAANYKPKWFNNLYRTKTVKVTFPNGGFSEFDTALRYAAEHQEVKRVIFGLDPNLLIRDPADAPEELPDYLYSDHPLGDIHYLWNKDVLLRSGYTALKKLAGNTQTMSDAFVWDGNVNFCRELALGSYERPEKSGTILPPNAFLEATRENLDTVERWLTDFPDTEFIFYLSPYSILYWDKTQRTGQTEAVLTALELAMEELTVYENAEVHCFLTDFDTITDLDNYADHIHVAGRVTYAMACALPEGTNLVDAESCAEVLDALRTFVVNYDYERIFSDGGSFS